MDVRRLQHHDYDARMKLSMYAFQYELTEDQLEAQRSRFKPEREWGVFEEDSLQAQLMIIPLQLYVNGQKLEMGGIAGVATWPEQRRQGHVARLLTHSLATMREQGQTLSCLAPFSFPFYRKYGWELYTELKRYTLEPSQLPGRVQVTGFIERQSAPEAIAEMQEVYAAYAPRYSGMLVRDAAWWLGSVLRKKPYFCAVYYSHPGQPTGYLLYTLENRVLQVKEMVYLDSVAQQGLWTFLSNHDSMITKLIVNAPSDDLLPMLLPDPRISQEIVPYFMARIVDIASFIALQRFSPQHKTVRLRLHVTDMYAPWNEGEWILSVTPTGQGCLTAAESMDEELPLASADIQTITAMLLGYQRPQKLASYGRLNAAAEAVHVLEQVVPHQVTYLLDYF